MHQRRTRHPRGSGPRHSPDHRAAVGTVSRVLVVDEHPIVGVALGALLGGEAGLKVDTATDPAAAMRAMADGSTDLVVSEIAFAGEGRGLDLLVSPASRPPIVVLTGVAFPSLLRAAIDAGVEGILSKAAPVDEIVAAIRTVAGGGTTLAPGVLDLARHARRRPAPRELAIIAEVATGATNATIAERLSIRRPTVEAVLRRLFDRYSVASRTALVGIAEREGWLFGRAA
jgi:DNA-binding NarL/FixJ family response regulator